MTRQEIYSKLREVFHSKSGCFLSKKSCEELAHEVSSYAETDYLMSLENYDHLKKAIKEFEGDLTDVVNIAQASGKQPAEHLKNINLDVFDHEAQEAEEEKYYQGFGYDKITPKALLELGFKEEYQPPIDGEVGYLFYDYDLYGMELLSTSTAEDEEFSVFTGNGHQIRSLKKLKNLISSLKEL